MRIYSRNTRHNCRYYLRMFSHDYQSLDWWTLAMALTVACALLIVR
jgi:hypothetical protein